MDFFRIAFISLAAFGAGATAVDLFRIRKRAGGKQKTLYAGRASGLLRTMAFFCLAAGPVGWIALYRGEGLAESLLWAAIPGCLFALLARVLLRLPKA